jgi:hypothetical protein
VFRGVLDKLFNLLRAIEAKKVKEGMQDGNE